MVHSKTPHAPTKARLRLRSAISQRISLPRNIRYKASLERHDEINSRVDIQYTSVSRLVAMEAADVRTNALGSTKQDLSAIAYLGKKQQLRVRGLLEVLRRWLC